MNVVCDLCMRVGNCLEVVIAVQVRFRCLTRE